MGQQIQIPNKSLFKMNEVCGLTGVKPYVLRFWETEFEQITPIVSSSGQKLYEHKDIESIMLIKKLLFDEKLTIEKAKAELTLRYDHHQAQAQEPIVEEVQKQQEELPPQLPQMPQAKEVKENKDHFHRSLSDRDIQKLVLAKAKLSGLLKFTQTIQESRHWN